MKPNIIKIAVTGSAGSGKSLVVKRLGRLGLVTFDCDRIAREVVLPGKKAHREIIRLFGDRVLREDGRLDRPALRRIMIGDAEKRRRLEAVMHPAIIETLFSRIRTADYAGEPAAVAEVPLLFELDLADRFDAVITVTAEEDALVERIRSRDGVGADDARSMLRLQMEPSEKIKRSDYVIENQGSIDHLNRQADKIYHAIKKRGLDKKRKMT